MLVFGSKTGTTTCAQPARSPAPSQAIPPMCVKGKTIATRSSGTSSSTSQSAREAGSSVWSVWSAPSREGPAHPHPLAAAERGREPPGELGVVEAAEDGGDQEHARAGLAQR